MLKKYFLLLILVYSFPFVYSQHKEIIKNEAAKQSIKTGDIEPNTIVFKLKKQFRNLYQNGYLPAINAKLEKSKGIKITSILPMFPGINAPEKEKNSLGQPLVDLSLIYRLHYEGTYDLQALIDLIQKTGFVEYAEPLYVDKILALPNDTYAQPGEQMEFYLKRMKAFEAFDVEDGDTNVVIGIIDTGVKWDHEDIKDNIKYNYADPIDGSDNDADGYVDNFRGWDLGNNDNNPYAATGNEHGTQVAGIAGATPNNGIGMIGTGNKCKVLPLKGSLDLPSSSIMQGYPAITYAANHNCKVVNLSWGGAGLYSQTSQNVINYAAINKDVVVVAAAGNDNTDVPYYPAAYDHVLSVAALDTMNHLALDSVIEQKAGFATYNHSVDIGAQGRRLVSTTYGGYTPNSGGSSFASPLVAGAAGLIRAKYPSLNALQVAELLRVTADPYIDTVAVLIPYKEKLGKGRINMYRALTDNTSPSVRMYEKKVKNDYGAFAASEDTVDIICKFRNFLQPTNNASVVLSTTNPNIEIIEGTKTLGSIPTLGTIDIQSDPFVIYVKPGAGIEEKVTFRLGYADPAKNYTDYQYFEIVVNPAFIDIDTNQVDLSITSNGRFGYSDDLSSVGNGLTYRGESILFESGLMISSSSTKVSDCVRGLPAGDVDFDFNHVRISKFTASPEGDEETSSVLSDESSPTPVGVLVNQRTYARKASPDDRYIIVEYDITNISGSTLDSLRVGIFADWDIQIANQNKANWNLQDSIGYTYYTGANGIYAGVCLLTNHKPSCFSMDHGATGGNNINPNDGFSPLEKYTTLSGGISRPQAGGSAVGFDVSQVVGGTIPKLLHNEKQTIAFAFVVGDDVLDLKANARRAKDQFRLKNTSPAPKVTSQHFCKYDTLDVTIAPGNGTKFTFNNTPSISNPVHIGNSYTIQDMSSSQSFYVRGADSLFESSAVKADIIFHTELDADFSHAPTAVDLNVNPYVYFVDKSDNTTSISWNLGDGTIVNDNPGFMHEYTTKGTYKIVLTATDVYGCEDTLSKYITVTGGPLSVDNSMLERGIKLYPNPSTDYLNVEFSLPSSQPIELKIVNVLGEQLYSAAEGSSSSASFKIELSDYSKGIYYARIRVGDKLISKTFVVQ